MTSLQHFITDQLEYHGLPSHYIHSVIHPLLSSDILSLAFRLFVVSLIVSQLKSQVAKLYVQISNRVYYTAHVSNGGGEWVRAYLYQDPNVQGQLRQYRLFAEAEATGVKRNMASRLFKRAGASSYEDGVCFRAKPLECAGDDLYSQVDKNCLPGSKPLVLEVYVWGYGVLAHHTTSVDLFDRLTLLRTYAWNHDAIHKFPLEAHRIYHEKDDPEIHLFNHTPQTAKWVGPAIRPARPWSSVILPGSTKDTLLKDVKEFVSQEEKDWYGSRGIPHRRGYLLYGPPGTGKTTLATAIASKLSMDLYIVNPAAPGMDNQKLQKCFRTCPKGSLLLIEDIDCVMPVNRARRGAAVNDNGGDDESQDAEVDGGDGGGENEEELQAAASSNTRSVGPSSVTLSGLLNAIDGVASQEDSVLFASTNYPHRLDEALRRPGRFDVHVAFNYAVHEQAVEIYKHFYPPSSAIQPLNDDEKAPKNHPTWDEAEASKRAEEFATTIIKPESEGGAKLSIAVIQGYLLLHKKDPLAALSKAGEWLEGLGRDALGKDRAATNGIIKSDRASLASDVGQTSTSTTPPRTPGP